MPQAPVTEEKPKTANVSQSNLLLKDVRSIRVEFMLPFIIKLRDVKVSSISPKVAAIRQCNGGYFHVDNKTSGQKYSFFCGWDVPPE